MIENKNPLVSVAIITYNQKQYLKECIDSILIQDYPFFEIVVADDGSTDGTQQMLNDYKERYKEKFVLRLSSKNRGLTQNSNAAHFACSGKYIFVMGGDDLMLPDKITTQVLFMEKNPNCSVCYHNLEAFDSETNKLLYYTNTHKNRFEGTLEEVVYRGIFNGACSTVYRRDKTPPHGYDCRIPIVSDWLYTMQTLENGGEIRYIDLVLGRYRKHKNNISADTTNLNGNKDLLNSCSILLLDHPEHGGKILYRYSEYLRALRIIDSDNYLNHVLNSLRIGFNLKSLISLILFICSFGRVKK